MKPLFSAGEAGAAGAWSTAEGEDERVLRACRTVVDEGLANPILDRQARRGRTAPRSPRAAHSSGKRFRAGQPSADPRCRDYWSTYHRLTERRAFRPSTRDRSPAPQHADRRDDDPQGRGRRHAVRRSSALTRLHLRYVDQVIGAGARASGTTFAMNSARAAAADRIPVRHLCHRRPDAETPSAR